MLLLFYFSRLHHNVMVNAMKPLRITDLGHLKLIGYCKPNKRTHGDQFLPVAVKVSLFSLF